MIINKDAKINIEEEKSHDKKMKEMDMKSNVIKE